MASTKFDLVNSIVNAKNLWNKYNSSGDATKSKEIAQDTTKYYNQLREMGYGDVADELDTSSYEEAYKLLDKYGTDGKQQTRSLVSAIAKGYGYDVRDSDFSFDQPSSNVYFMGVNLGKADYISSEGRSYYNSGTLDAKIHEILNTNGIYKPASNQINEGNAKISSNIDQLWGTVNTDKTAMENRYKDVDQKINELWGNINSDKTEMKERYKDVDNKINTLWGTMDEDKKTMQGKYDKLEDYNYNTNPYETEIGKSIMDGFRWQGVQASANESAQGGAGNSGNIDSFSAANASRQQAAFESYGKNAVLQDFNSRVNNARNILADLGYYNDNMYNQQKDVISRAQTQNSNLENYQNSLYNQMQNAIGYSQNQNVNLGNYQSNLYNQLQNTIGLSQSQNQRLSDNDQTAKNNQVQRDVLTSQVTGTVPNSMEISNNPFYNSDGTLKNKDIDYKAIIDAANRQLETETDPEKINNLKYTIKYANDARIDKIQNYPEYTKESDAIRAYAPSQTAAVNSENKQLEQNRYMFDEGIKHESNMTDKQLSSSERLLDKEIAGNIQLANINNQNQFSMNRDNNETQLAISNLKNQIAEGNTPVTGISSGTVAGGDYDDLINEIAGKYKVPPALVKAVMQVESSFDSSAVSSSGAKGLMQLMDNTARGLGVTNSFDAQQNIEGGVKYLKEQLDAFGGVVELALAAYNAGPGAVKKYQGIPPDAQNYVKKVMSALYKYDSDARQAGTSNTVPNISGGEKIKVVDFSAITNEDYAKKFGIDEYGMELLNTLKSQAVNKGGFLTEDEIFHIAINTSDENNTNLDQIIKVYNYLELDTTNLENNVKDKVPFIWNWGVKLKK